MNRADFILELAITLDISQTEAHKIVDGFLETLARCMEKEEQIKFRNFGIFTIKKRKARFAQDMNRRETIRMPERFVPVFKPYDKLKNRLQNRFLWERKKQR